MNKFKSKNDSLISQARKTSFNLIKYYGYIYNRTTNEWKLVGNYLGYQHKQDAVNQVKEKIGFSDMRYIIAKTVVIEHNLISNQENESIRHQKS